MRVALVGGAAAVVLAVVAGLYLRVIWARVKGQHIGLAILAALLIAYAGTKPTALIITFDDGLRNNASHWGETNTYSYIHFAWTRTNPALPATQPLYVSRMPKDITGAEWETVATTTVGAWQYDLYMSNLTNYEFYVWHEWVPPTPVHTNGVWVGNVVEKTVGTVTNKYIIINGKLRENGKELTK